MDRRFFIKSLCALGGSSVVSAKSTEQENTEVSELALADFIALSEALTGFTLLSKELAHIYYLDIQNTYGAELVVQLIAEYQQAVTASVLDAFIAQRTQVSHHQHTLVVSIIEHWYTGYINTEFFGQQLGAQSYLNGKVWSVLDTTAQGIPIANWSNKPV